MGLCVKRGRQHSNETTTTLKRQIQRAVCVAFIRTFVYVTCLNVNIYGSLLMTFYNFNCGALIQLNTRLQNNGMRLPKYTLIRN